MAEISYRGHRFPPIVVQHAVWLYLRFTLSYRDVEELLAERGLDVSYETIRRWVATFGPRIARRLRAGRPVPHRRWHLDEMFVRIAGKPMYLWRAVDAEAEFLEVLVQANRDQGAAAKCMRTLHPMARAGSIIVPGLSRRRGSRACFAALRAAAKSSGRWRSYHGRWSRP